jgi:hypothetical protein
MNLLHGHDMAFQLLSFCDLTTIQGYGQVHRFTRDMRKEYLTFRINSLVGPYFSEECEYNVHRWNVLTKRNASLQQLLAHVERLSKCCPWFGRPCCRPGSHRVSPMAPTESQHRNAPLWYREALPFSVKCRIYTASTKCSGEVETVCMTKRYLEKC